MQQPHGPAVDVFPRQRRRAARRHHAALAAGVTAAVFALPGSSRAAETGTPEPGGPTLPTLIVTARQGEERLKDVPFSVTVIDGKQVEERRLLTLEDALRGTAGVNVNSSGSPNDSNVYVRGVGSLYQMSMDDTAVVINLDGVSVSQRFASLGTLDVARIEVLKGPQGTLFGGNAEAGAINIVSRRPTPYAEGYVRAEAGQAGRTLLEAAVGGPLSERLQGRFAARRQGGDSWVENTQAGGPLARPRDLAFRGSLNWNLADHTTALFIADRQEIKNSPSLFVPMPFGDDPAVSLQPGLLDRDRKTVARYSAEIEHRLAGSRLTSVTALTRADFRGTVYYDQNLYAALNGTTGEYWQRQRATERVTSQDLRWSSLPGAAMFWATGVNLSHGERTYDTPEDTMGSTTAYFRNFTTNRYGLYGEATRPLTDTLKLTVGARHSWDRKRYDATYVTAGTSTDDARALDAGFTTGRVALNFALSRGTTLYGILSHGHNPGGFNDFATQPADSEPYRPSASNTVELGFKHESADRRYTLNGGLFGTWVDDAHLLSFDAATFASRAVNANTRSRGAELEGSARVLPELTLSGSLSYIDATITSNVFDTGNGDVLAGNRMPDVSRWSANLIAAYQRPLPAWGNFTDGAFKAQVGYRFVGRRAADPQNHFDLGSYGKVDARVGVAAGLAEVYVWGDNLGDKQYALYGFSGSDTVRYGAPSRGRTLGVGAQLQF